jgi:hypothetical protein
VDEIKGGLAGKNCFVHCLEPSLTFFVCQI